MAEERKRVERSGGDSSEGKPPKTRAESAAKPDPKAAPAVSKAEPKPRPESADKPKASASTKARRVRKPAAPKPAAERKPSRRRRREPVESKTPKPAPVRPVVRAQAKYVRSSARKARLVIEHIRGKSLDEARAVLRHSTRGIARDLERLLESAAANAENNHELVADDLYVKDAYADEGPTIRRFRPRAMGRATRIRKRTAHLTVMLTPRDSERT
jgi:ribosomal protein L22